MTSTTNNNNNNNSGSSNKLFHTYENVGYDDQQVILANSNHTIIPSSSSSSSLSNVLNTCNNNNNNNNNNSSSSNSNTSNGIGSFGTATTVNVATSGAVVGCGGNGGGGTSATGVTKNITAIESPFVDPIIHDTQPSTASVSVASNITPNPAIAAGATTKILSTTDSTGTTRMLTTARAPPAGQNLVTKLITFPSQSSMDSLKEWSVSTFKCTKQLINEKRGICPVTNDSQLQNDIEQLRENRYKLVQMLRYGQQMTNHYTQLVKTQKQLHSLMNEMSIKCFNTNNNSNINSNSNNHNHHHHSISNNNNNNNNHLNSYTSNKQPSSKQVIANFSSLGNNLSSSTTTTSPTHHHKHHHHQQQHSSTSSSNNHGSVVEANFEHFLPVLNYMNSSNLSLVDDFKKNAMTLNVAIKNGEKLIAALSFYCSNLSTLIDKTIEDTLITVKQYESARLEYDAEKNSLNFISQSAQSSITYSSDKLELARMRYEQHKEDVQIKMKFLEENTIKVMHKQLLIFNGAFASYTSGNTAALDATLKQFSIRDSSC